MYVWEQLHAHNGEIWTMREIGGIHHDVRWHHWKTNTLANASGSLSTQTLLIIKWLNTKTVCFAYSPPELIGHTIFQQMSGTGRLLWGRSGLKYLGVYLGREEYKRNNWECLVEKVLFKLALAAPPAIIQGKSFSLKQTCLRTPWGTDGKCFFGLVSIG